LSQNVGGWAAAASLTVLATLQSYFLVQQWQMVLMSRVMKIARARKPTMVNAHSFGKTCGREVVVHVSK